MNDFDDPFLKTRGKYTFQGERIPMISYYQDIRNAVSLQP